MVILLDLNGFQPAPLTDYRSPKTDFKLKCCVLKAIFV